MDTGDIKKIAGGCGGTAALIFLVQWLSGTFSNSPELIKRAEFAEKVAREEKQRASEAVAGRQKAEKYSLELSQREKEIKFREDSFGNRFKEKTGSLEKSIELFEAARKAWQLEAEQLKSDFKDKVVRLKKEIADKKEIEEGIRALLQRVSRLETRFQVWEKLAKKGGLK